MDLSSLATYLSVIIASVTAAAGASYYVSRLQSKLELSKLEADFSSKLDLSEQRAERAEKSLEDSRSDLNRLRNRLDDAHRVGAAASAQKQKIDDQVAALLEDANCKGASVYIPFTPHGEDKPEGLVFASILPLDKKRLKLRDMIMSLDESNAGRCFLENRSIITRDPATDESHSKKADEISGYIPKSILSIPLKGRNEVIGVLQLIDRENHPFEDEDVKPLASRIDSIARSVEDFSQMPGCMQVLGIRREGITQSASIMFCDITKSSMLFSVLDKSGAIRILNDLLTGICDVALKSGATVDKYTGDGVMLRFNVPTRLLNHEEKSVECAKKIMEEFVSQKANWPDDHGLAQSVFLRIGIATGEVLETPIGHPQYRYMTVLGQTVNRAAAICEEAERSANSIYIDEAIADCLEDKASITLVSVSRGSKLSNYAKSIYSLDS